MAQAYQPWELNPRGVLKGLDVSLVAGEGNGMKLSVSKGIWRCVFNTPAMLEKKTATEITITAPAEGEGVVIPIYANPDGSISLTPEADATVANPPMFLDPTYNGTKGRSVKIAEVTVNHDTTTLTEAMVSEKCRFAFDKFYSEMNGLHNVSTNVTM